jgi:riboflavin kinase/FMN adenylyltransferase
MEAIAGWRNVPSSAKGAVLAIGNFDGVHRGHQAVLRRAIEIAKKEGKPSGAVVFEPHPREYFRPGEPFFRLTPLPVKLELLAALGLDQTFVIEFGPELSTLSAEAFVIEVLTVGLGAAGAVVGYDFAYGKGRTGTTALLEAIGAERGFKVEIVQPVAQGGTIFSSSTIREYLRNGDVREAAEQLGYWWRVRGKVEPGAGRGRELGFPTINLPLSADLAIGHGIYAARVSHRGLHHDAAGYVGLRPTFAENLPVLEVHLFADIGNLHGEEVEVELVAKLREDSIFSSRETLAAQMATDCEAARIALGMINASDHLTTTPLSSACVGNVLATRS